MSPSRPARAAAPLAALLLACGDDAGGPLDASRVRVRNASAVELRSVLLVLPGDERIGAATLTPGAAGGYVRAPIAYRYAYAEAVVDGRRLVLQPIDYVGEQPLGPGCWTYDLTLDATRQQLGIAARADSGC